ncbi:MAG: hypothetical protein SAJ37_20205 [Oscillatoria sp. PMC 1068.18]|nr:hypothetical protein [Oscillatoria sp. PMC 1076.18]MEC4991064.1 hypothetical protein [Oscillatoria sp. PMC 1068.18]
MNLKQFATQHLDPNKDFSKPNLVIEKSFNQTQNQVREDNNNILSLPTAVPLLVGLMGIFVAIKFNNILQKRLGKLDKISRKLPCSKCVYFENNPYLKCAVRPDLVLTKEATNCKDYRLNSEAEMNLNEN